MLKTALRGQSDKMLFGIETDERSNRIHITGPPNIRELAIKLLDQIDRAENSPRIVGGPRTADPLVKKTYQMPHGSAPAIVKNLSLMFPPNPTPLIWDIGSDQILVWASPVEQEKIAATLVIESAKNEVSVEEADVQKWMVDLENARSRLRLKADEFMRLKNVLAPGTHNPALDAAQAAVIQAEAEVKSAQSNAERANAVLQRARRAVLNNAPPVPVDNGDVELQQLEERMAWAQRMHAKGYITKAAVEQAAAEVIKAREDRAAKQKKSSAPVGGSEPPLADLEDRLNVLQRLQAKGYASEVEVDRARLAVAEARIAVEMRTIRDLYKKNPGLK